EPSFWWVSFGHASALFVVAAINVHLQIHLTESLGYTLGEAARVMALITAMFMIGNLAGGIIGDYASKRVLAIICMIGHMVGMVLISHATTTPVVILGSVIHGLVWGARGPQMAAIRAEYFGRASFGKIMGVSNALIIIGTIAGPMIAGYLYDTTGSYQLGFDIIAALSGGGSIFFVLAKRPKPPVRPAPVAA
ncbi:MAG: MFS transporter, partial [Chloroflexi bacterium]|nr:MFS transporter [Chloroflexota bacterium]